MNNPNSVGEVLSTTDGLLRIRVRNTLGHTREVSAVGPEAIEVDGVHKKAWVFEALEDFGVVTLRIRSFDGKVFCKEIIVTPQEDLTSFFGV
jgi:hypothetical protein